MLTTTNTQVFVAPTHGIYIHETESAILHHVGDVISYVNCPPYLDREGTTCFLESPYHILDEDFPYQEEAILDMYMEFLGGSELETLLAVLCSHRAWFTLSFSEGVLSVTLRDTDRKIEVSGPTLINDLLNRLGFTIDSK